MGSTIKIGIEELVESRALDGYYPIERDLNGPFVWTRAAFQLRMPLPANFMTLRLAYLGNRGSLRVFEDDRLFGTFPLIKGWQDCPISVATTTDMLSFKVDPLPPIEFDDRELGVMLRTISLFNEEQQFARKQRVSANAVLNDAEFRLGSPSMISHPPNLRVTTEVRCNIPETGQACTYCAWDWAKAMEEGSPPFELDTLDQLGGFYDDAQMIGDCSIGEPTMNRHFGEIVARFDKDEKPFSFTTNGQLLVRQRRHQLLGKNIDLYVSIDAATADGFKRYRNDRFETIIENLRALCSEKRAHGNLPTVTPSFIVMRSNADELDMFLRLMKDIGADRVKLRTLYLDDNVAPVVINNGYRFDYANEVLLKDELAALSIRARQIADEISLPLYLEWDEFEGDVKTDQGQPLCAEPWKTLYVLRRGIMPCCYATEPIAHWKDRGDRTIEQFLSDVFNSDAYQDLRAGLASGDLAAYCRNTPSCPVAKRMSDDSGAMTFGKQTIESSAS